MMSEAGNPKEEIVAHQATPQGETPVELDDEKEKNKNTGVKRPQGKEDASSDEIKVAEEDSKPSSKRAKVNDDEEKESSGDEKHEQPLNFPGRLMELLQREVPPPGLDWMEDGKAFTLHNQKIIETLNKYYQGSKLMSFTRTLNKW